MTYYVNKRDTFEVQFKNKYILELYINIFNFYI